MLVVAIILEPFRKVGPDKGEWQFDLNGGAGKPDGGTRKPEVGKRDGSIRGLDGIGKLADASSSLPGTFDAFQGVIVGFVDFAGKLVDSSGKGISGFNGIRMLIGGAIIICNCLSDALPSLARFSGEFR